MGIVQVQFVFFLFSLWCVFFFIQCMYCSLKVIRISILGHRGLSNTFPDASTTIANFWKAFLRAFVTANFCVFSKTIGIYRVNVIWVTTGHDTSFPEYFPCPVPRTFLPSFKVSNTSHWYSHAVMSPLEQSICACITQTYLLPPSEAELVALLLRGLTTYQIHNNSWAIQYFYLTVVLC